MSSFRASSALLFAESRDTSRPILFSSLIAVGASNALSRNVGAAVAEQGILSATLNSFGVSVFVWLALGAGLLLLWRSPAVGTNRLDWALASAAGIAMLVPVPDLSWFAVSALVLCLFTGSPPGSPMRRGATILLAVTIPMFWARVFMSFFNEVILAIDATLVSLAVGTDPDGNIVPFADGSGSMWIAPGCSSFTNLSLAILALVGVVNVTSGRWSSAKLGLGALACVLVVVINVTRISLIGYYPEHYGLIHGEVGASIAGWLTTMAIAAIGWFAARRDAITLG
ncbi:exosortase/archaeosortase family protein [Devosia submarina]|uniref:exosortase/archaeosortase family protein n=1 Tax=Devosia submarina TaxID=1173082 RepID=UPI00130078BD|nr:exosortase/archaeosortase family protein [Devosia submarina]